MQWQFGELSTRCPNLWTPIGTTIHFMTMGAKWFMNSVSVELIKFINCGMKEYSKKALNLNS